MLVKDEKFWELVGETMDKMYTDVAKKAREKPTSADGTGSQRLSTGHFLAPKNTAVEYVGGLLRNLKPGLQLTMTIKLVKSGDFYVHTVTDTLSDDTQTPTY